MRCNFWNALFLVLATLLLNRLAGFAQTATNSPPPSLPTIVQRAMTCAIANEDTNTILFNTHYRYTRIQSWKYHNDAGKLTKLKYNRTEENTPPTNPVASKINRLVHGRDLKLSSYPVTNMVSRFDFNLIGEENVAGRPAYVIDFVPRKNLPVSHLIDPLVNRAVGRVWIDQEDYAIAKGQFHLNSPVKVVGGMVGQLKNFSCNFSRSRTKEGYWFVQRIEWHLEELIVQVARTIDYHEERMYQRPLNLN